MALNKIKLSDGRFIYRCDSCPFEYPRDPVKEHELGPPPPHHCKGSDEIRFDMKDILSGQDQAVPTLHLGDIVEEIATKRRGKLDGGPTKGQGTLRNWRVCFIDGQKPVYRTFENDGELRLVSCPHTQDGPSFKPDRSIM